MGKKRKKKFVAVAVEMLKRLDALKYDEDADYDAVVRAQNQLAVAAKLRNPQKRKKSLEQQIELAEANAAKKQAQAEQKAAKLKKRNAAAVKKRAADKKAKAA